MQPTLVMTLSLRPPPMANELPNCRMLRQNAVAGAPVIRLLEGCDGIASRIPP